MFNRPVFFYTEDGKLKIYRFGASFASGACAEVYKIDNDTCLKWINCESVIHLDALKAIRELTLDNFYQIHDFLYDKHKSFSGYTMKYYENGIDNILLMPTEYTLSNLYRLYESFEKVSNKSIVVDDMHSGNVILGADKITVIDTDMYYFSRSDRRRIIKRNYLMLLNLFKQLYYDGMDKLNYDTRMINQINNTLFSESEGLINIEKKLIKYEKPIDYIRNMRGNYE